MRWATAISRGPREPHTLVARWRRTPVRHMLRAMSEGDWPSAEPRSVVAVPDVGDRGLPSGGRLSPLRTPSSRQSPWTRRDGGGRPPHVRSAARRAIPPNVSHLPCCGQRMTTAQGVASVVIHSLTSGWEVEMDFPIVNGPNPSYLASGCAPLSTGGRRPSSIEVTDPAQ
jgi:hypothetical protein